MRRLWIMLGFIKNDATQFQKKKSEMFNVFTKTRDELLTLVQEQRLYSEKQAELKTKAQYEIDVTSQSINDSLETIDNLSKFIK